MKREKREFPDLYPTSVGWMDPNTGELLSSIKNLKNSVDLTGHQKHTWKQIVQDHITKERKEREQKASAVNIVIEKTPAPVVQEEVKVEVKEAKKPAVKKTATKKKAATKKTTAKKQK